MCVYCNNCGNEGHIYRHCKYPVLSYGIVCIHTNKILMIQRKDSICYIEFIRGKYKLDNKSYILNLLNRCSIEERNRLKNNSFDWLWNTLWFSGKEKKVQTDRMIKEYHTSKELFEKLQPELLPKLISKCNTSYDTPEWEFPKGRRSTRETNKECAIRGFEEETDLTNSQYTLLDNVSPISEEYMGSNGVRYKHIYYFAIYKDNIDNELLINRDKYEQYSEISDLQWVPIDEVKTKIRKEYKTKLKIADQLKSFIENLSKDFIFKE